MTTLGSMFKGGKVAIITGQPLDLPSLAAHVSYLTAAGTAAGPLGSGPAILASIAAWTEQDDDAHEPCSLTACRHPLHPGPCKGWKGTLHSVSPGTYKQIEEARVEKANARRLKRIADLKAQGKPIPRRLLDEIKPKPAPAHPANNAQAVPLGQVNQKADLAGGQAHHAGAAVTKAAGVQVNTPPPLPLGPKQKKPTVAGRGPAFVITQPKVTDHYKLDKAEKITPQEWAALSDVDKATIRNELTAIKARGFGPQQTRADALLLKLSSPNVPGTAPTAPGKVSLGQATKALLLSPNATPEAKYAHGVANRTAPRANLSKTQVNAYDKLTKADFDSLPPDTQKTIRNDLADAKGKFLDPKKQQAAQDLLDRFGSRHAAPPPAAPSGAKGYSDPMSQAVKAASDGTVRTDDLLKRVGALSQPSIKSLDDADRKKILGRLAFVAAHPQATPDQKERATAYGRIINKGPHTDPGKLDHEPSLGELHAHEQKNPASHPDVAAALKAADLPGAPRADRVAALTALSKAQFDSLKPDEQRKLTDALQSLHLDRSDPHNTVRDPSVGDALTTYTGQHPAMHRLQQAEADFRAGKINGDDVQNAFRTARVQALGGTDNATEVAVDAEAARIARDNPALPTYARVSLAGEPKYGTTAYSAISLAGMRHNWEPAPRLSFGDMQGLFRPTKADMAAVDPIHAEAVRDLQARILTTGLAPGSPWSTPTKGAAVDALLGTGRYGVIPADRLDLYRSLPLGTRVLVQRTLMARRDSQTSSHAKTETWITLHELGGTAPLTGAKRDAALAAANPFVPAQEAADAFRKLTPDEFDEFPSYAQDAIRTHLAAFQRRIALAGPVRTWTPQDNALKVFPDALMAHLAGARTQYASRQSRNASDIANYGTGIINPLDRVRVYEDVPASQFALMSGADQNKINADLDLISHNTGLTLQVRYGAQYTKDFALIPSRTPAHLNRDQIYAVESADPANHMADSTAFINFNNLDKADFDQLDATYRDAIDARIGGLSGSDQQFLNAKLHPAAPQAATPAGVTPTTVQANVPPHVQEALDTIYGAHPKSHTMAHQLSSYGALRGSDFSQLNSQEQNHLLSDLSFIATTAKGPSADKAKKLIDRFTPPGTPAGQISTPPIVPPANSVPGQVRYANPLKGTLVQAKDKGVGGDGWLTTPGGKRVWGKYGAAGLLLMHQDPQTGERRYLMVQRGPAISDPGKWQFPGGAIDSKESFHEGGTREVIEELGFKADALKDAEVHGEHTNAIPGSTWKYVSVAAQVPQMLKPDLSTHHARAETSDAQWMTEAEIRALDTSGKLLAPLAGGKLEQNVLSLFPKTPAPGTLGQIARPGPVSKRLKRLTLPSGGRQAPAQFNAWPHAHKQSTGKNLIADKAALDAQRQKIKQDRGLYDGKTADGRLAAIGAQQGFDDTPTVLDKKEIDRLLASGDYIEAWRGVTGAGGSSWRSRGTHGGKTAAQINDEMRSGPAYYGKGIFGNGYYLATQKRVADQYADGTKGSIVRVLIPKAALTEKYDKVEKEAHSRSTRTSKAKGSYGETSTFWDPGRFAAAKGLDGIEIESHHTSGGGGARHVAQPGKPAFNWLNRSVLILQKEPG